MQPVVFKAKFDWFLFSLLNLARIATETDAFYSCQSIHFAQQFEYCLSTEYHNLGLSAFKANTVKSINTIKKAPMKGLFLVQVQISDLKRLKYQYLFANVHTAHQMLYVLLVHVLSYQSQRTTSSRRTPMALQRSLDH